VIIQRFNFQSEFDCKKIILKLIDTNRTEIAKQLCDKNEDLKDYMINCLATNENCKVAAGLIKQWGKDINQFPSVKERIMKSSMRYYLGRYLYNKPGQDEYMSLERVEDMFMGFKPMLVYLVEDLVFKNKVNEAKGVVDRHGILFDLREEVREQLSDVVYDPNKSSQPVDFFGPLSEGNHMRLPNHVTVEMISTVEDIPKLDVLFADKYIGVDSEWRPAVAKFHKTNPALFQISGSKQAFLLDFYTLGQSEELDQKLSQLFSD
jgi:hypothetical protein